MHWVADVEFAVRVMLGQVMVKPFAGLASGVRTMVPAKLNVLVTSTVITELGLPRSILIGLLIDTVKSPMWTVAVAAWIPVIDPVPVIVTE